MGGWHPLIFAKTTIISTIINFITMKTKLIFGGLACFLLASCSQEAFEAPVQEQYAQEFSKLFGSIDPNQNWSMAERKSVNVTAEPGSTVSVYAFNGETYKLAARYTDFSGNGTVSFDAAAGCDNVIVTDGTNTVSTTTGSSVTLMSSRAGVDDITITKDSEYKTIDLSDLKNFVNKLVPEQVDNTSKSGLTKNFAALPKVGERVRVYPAYWQHAWFAEVGIYINDENDQPVLMEPFFYDGDVQSSVQYQTTNAQVKNGTWTDAESNHQDSPWSAYTMSSVKNVRSLGWELDVPVGQLYGFYIKVYEDKNKTGYKGTYYSEARHNPKSEKYPNGVSMASYAKAGDQTFIGFEDDPNASEKDLNDIVLMLDPVPYIVDHEPDGFILAAEDLGNTGDFDFNDVVFSVTHIAGEKTAIVTPLAAGGTLPIQLYYDGKPVGGEFHSLFGGSKSSEMINTDKITKAADPIEIEVPGDFAIGEYADYDNNENSHFRKFTISINNGQTMLTAPKNGAAPQIMCLPANWEWPKEQVNIQDAYPDFGDWGKNYSNTEWIKNKIDGMIIR